MQYSVNQNYTEFKGIKQHCPCCDGDNKIESIKQQTAYIDDPKQSSELTRAGYVLIRNVFYCSNCRLSIHQIRQKFTSQYYK